MLIITLLPPPPFPPLTQVMLICVGYAIWMQRKHLDRLSQKNLSNNEESLSTKVSPTDEKTEHKSYNKLAAKDQKMKKEWGRFEVAMQSSVRCSCCRTCIKYFLRKELTLPPAAHFLPP